MCTRRPMQIQTKDCLYVFDNADWYAVLDGKDHPYSDVILTVYRSLEGVRLPDTWATLNLRQREVWARLIHMMKVMKKSDTSLVADEEFIFQVDYSEEELISVINVKTKMFISGKLSFDTVKVNVNSLDWDFLVGDIDDYLKRVWTCDQARSQVIADPNLSDEMKELDEVISAIVASKEKY